jgi:hypothetical protein
MKKISDSRKLLGATSATNLKELNGLYKSLMKAHHPDRFPNDEAKRHEAEELSKHLIDAYKFLESIHPETHVLNAESFEASLASNIRDWHYKSLTLHVTFGNGSTYEFYGVPQKTYNKFVATDGNTRFAKRHIFGACTFRRTAAAPVA